MHEPVADFCKPQRQEDGGENTLAGKGLRKGSVMFNKSWVFGVVGSALLGGSFLGAASVADPAATEPAPTYAGHIYMDFATGATTSSPAGVGDVYANTTTVTAGASSTDLVAVFGDRVTMTGSGFLDQIDFSIFNSGSSAGPVLTATFNLTFYDGTVPPLPAPFGGFTTAPVNFGAGLNPGFYSLVTVTGLSGLGINLTTDVLLTQTVTSFTGTATRFGIVFADPPTIGSSLLPAANTCYIQATTFGGGVPGYYSFAAPNGNVAYRINVSDTPVELMGFSVE